MRWFWGMIVVAAVVAGAVMLAQRGEGGERVEAVVGAGVAGEVGSVDAEPVVAVKREGARVVASAPAAVDAVRPVASAPVASAPVVSTPVVTQPQARSVERPVEVVKPVAAAVPAPVVKSEAAGERKAEVFGPPSPMEAGAIELAAGVEAMLGMEDGSGVKPLPASVADVRRGGGESGAGEVVKAEPVKVEAAKSDPAKADPAKADPTKADPAKAEPVKAGAAGAARPAMVASATKAKLTARDDGTTLVDDKYVIKGAGTKDDPYVISWEMLVSAQETYQPRLGRRVIPDRLMMLSGKWVRLSGFIAFPIMAQSQDEMLMMLNQWDGCCIGVPPTPYDAVEVKLRSAAKGDDRLRMSGSIKGVLRVDPYLVKDWLVSLYLMDEGDLSVEANAAKRPATGGPGHVPTQ